MTALIIAKGLDEALQFVSSVPELAEEAAFFAVNDTARGSVPLIKRTMRKQINFPGSYLNTERLNIRQRATRTRLQATILARDRPTSLARFAEGATIANSRGKPIFVKVKTSGGATKMKRAFLVNLKNGNAGLAIRLPPGKVPDRAYHPVELTHGGGKSTGAWLFYGPSVDQVMKGVIPEVSDEIQNVLVKNFYRQFSRLSGGRG